MTSIIEQSSRSGSGPGTVRRVPAAPVLFLAMFAAQSTLFVLSPMLPRLAQDFGVPVAAVGQLRAISGLVAGITPFALGPLARRLPLRDLIAAGLCLVAAGSLAVSLAVDFAMLAAAHVAIGAGLAVVVVTCLAATGEWAPEGGRTRLLSWTMMGPPTAAILGTLASGLLADHGWRVAWIAVPFAMSLLAAIAVRARPRDGAVARPRAAAGSVWQVPGVAGWALGELLAYSAWSMVLVYSGALLVVSYGASPALAASAISASAAAFMLGNRLTRRRLRAARPILLGLALALSAAGAAFAALRWGFWFSALLLVVLGLLNGGRSLAGSAFGLAVAPGHGVEVMAVRTAAQQLGYLVGAGLGGVALATRGYAGLGVLVGTLFAVAALPHGAAVWRGSNRRERTRTAPAAGRNVNAAGGVVSLSGLRGGSGVDR